ncbi:piggyBac transposable element-derived protein 4-like [Salvelinus alpinus]
MSRDNFFTSYELSQQLLKRKITMVGTVRKNKPTTTLVSDVPKKNKNVVLLSTLHKTAEISDREDRKQAIILDDNHNKGGMDNLDKVIGTYSCRRMTARWPLVIFHNIIDVSSYNAFVIWNKIIPTWMPDQRNKRRVFLEQLGKALVTPLIQRREHLPRTAASKALVKAVQGAESCPDPPKAAAGAGKRTRCQFCPPKKDCKTNTMCCTCEKCICKVHAHTLAYCPTCANSS